jgi:hypothetical protein
LDDGEGFAEPEELVTEAIADLEDAILELKNIAAMLEPQPES